MVYGQDKAEMRAHHSSKVQFFLTIDLMDEAASRVKLHSLTAPKEVKKIEEKINEIVKEKEDAINTQNFEKAAKLRDKECNCIMIAYIGGEGEGNGTPLQYSCLRNPMDRGAW